MLVGRRGEAPLVPPYSMFQTQELSPDGGTTGKHGKVRPTVKVPPGRQTIDVESK